MADEKLRFLRGALVEESVRGGRALEPFLAPCASPPRPRAFFALLCSPFAHLCAAGLKANATHPALFPEATAAAAAPENRNVGASLGGGLAVPRGGEVAAEQPVARPPMAAARRRPGSLRAELVAAARLSPAEAIAWLESDPLGVESANVTTWQCPAPSERLGSGSGPAWRAAQGLRSGEPGRAFVWFEHLSKAGGTSFCEFVRKNVGMRRTPPYYCMPSDGAKIPGTDGRVGTWPAAQLEAYLDRTKHAVVANEWDAFPASMLRSSPRLADSAVLATVIRDPIDRLVSAYRFWGVLHNPSPQKPSLRDWLEREDRGARRNPIRHNRDHFASQVGRNNFATWKFSSELEPRFDDCAPDDRDCHAESFETALANLERFHVVAPTKWQAAAKPLWSRLGFTKLDEVHIVPSGKIQDSKGDDQFDPLHYAQLKRDNHLDYLLFAWARRAFLEHVKCPEEAF